MYQLYIQKYGIWVAYSSPMTAYEAAQEIRQLRERGLQVQRLAV